MPLDFPDCEHIDKVAVTKPPQATLNSADLLRQFRRNLVGGERAMLGQR
jgi:hypothetical protein